MEAAEKAVVFGKPEFWPKVIERHGPFLEKVPALERAVSSIVDPAHKEVDYQQHLLMMLLQLVAIGMNEVVTLVANGMGHGAMKIVRGMVENAINAEYIRRFPEEGEKYREWHWIELHKQMNRVSVTSPGLVMEISKAKRTEIETEYQRVKGLFQYKVANKDGSERTVHQESWCRENLFERAEKINALDTYITVMPFANQILHGTIGGWLAEIDPSDMRIEYPPTERWGSESLIAAHAALIQAIETASKSLKILPEPSIAELEEDFNAIWHMFPTPGEPEAPGAS